MKYTKEAGRSETWLNSCDTNSEILHYKRCTQVLGFIGIAAHNLWALIPGAYALACYTKQGDVENAQANSSVKAVKWYYYHVTRVGGNGSVDGQIYISAKILSQ